MPLCGSRKKGTLTEQQKWDYINLSDFKCSSCLTGFSYFWLWVLVLTGVAVYAADTFTAVNLLAFNRFPSEVQPAIPFNVSKWIFAVCILFSWALLGYEFFRASRVIRRGSVAESYLDDVAVYIQSTRMGKNGRGWRRFLVFAELTKSAKGVDYIALFVYFQFKGAVRILVAEGPRVVVNALTLYAILKAELVPEGKNKAEKGRSSADQFFFNVQTLAEQDRKQAFILFAMLFTLVIWVITALCLFIASVLYILFLWHYIPSADGRLSHYCRRKIENRLERIVGAKVRKAIDKQEAKRQREEKQAIRNGHQPLRQPTLPMLNTSDSASEFSLSRQNTQGTVSTQPSRYHANMQRTGTLLSTGSATSYASDAPLLNQPDGMGYSMPAHHNANTSNSGYNPSPVSRTGTPQSDWQQGYPAPSYRGLPVPSRQNTGSAAPDRAPRGPPGPMGSPSRQNTASSHMGPNRLPPNQNPFSSRPFAPRAHTPGAYPSYQASPIDSAASASYARPGPTSPDAANPYGSAAGQPRHPPVGNGYQPFNPRTYTPVQGRSQMQPPRTGTAPPRAHYPMPRPPVRSATDPMGQREVQRQTHGYTDLVDDYAKMNTAQEGRFI